MLGNSLDFKPMMNRREAITAAASSLSVGIIGPAAATVSVGTFASGPIQSDVTVIPNVAVIRSDREMLFDAIKWIYDNHSVPSHVWITPRPETGSLLIHDSRSHLAFCFTSETILSGAYKLQYEVLAKQLSKLGDEKLEIRDQLLPGFRHLVGELDRDRAVGWELYQSIDDGIYAISPKTADFKRLHFLLTGEEAKDRAKRGALLKGRLEVAIRSERTFDEVLRVHGYTS